MLTKSTDSIKGYWLILGGALLWGTTGTAQSFAPQGYDPFLIGALRLLIAGPALLAISYWRQDLPDWNHLIHWQVLLAAACTALYQLCFFSGVARTGIAVGTVVGIGSAPIAGGILAFLFHGEALRSRWYLATTLAIGGCLLLSLTKGSVTVDPIGILLAMGAGFFYAAFTLLVKFLLRDRLGFSVMAVIFCLGALMLSPLYFQDDVAWLFRPASIAVALYLGLAATAIPYLMFAAGLKTVKVSEATTLSLAEPMTAAALGVLILGEVLNLQATIGIGLIFSGLLVMVLAARSKTG